MLLLELSFLKKSPKMVTSQLTDIHQMTRINNISKCVPITKNITTSTKNFDESIELGNTALKTKMKTTVNTSKASKDRVKLEKGKRPRGRPRKIVLQNNTNLLDKFTDAGTYLQYANAKSLRTDSGIFMGTLYELQVKKYLEEKFKIQSTLHQGGSNDKGIDLNAIWNPTTIFPNEEKSLVGHENKKFEVVNSKKVKPLLQRRNKKIKLFVQCKCFNTSKISPKLIREIRGSCQDYFKKHGNSAVFMLASTNGFTRIGREDFDKAPLPLIFAKFSKPKLINKQYPYDLESWDIGELCGMYLNPLAVALFKGLNWIEFTKNLT